MSAWTKNQEGRVPVGSVWGACGAPVGSLWGAYEEPVGSLHWLGGHWLHVQALQCL